MGKKIFKRVKWVCGEGEDFFVIEEGIHRKVS